MSNENTCFWCEQELNKKKPYVSRGAMDIHTECLVIMEEEDRAAQDLEWAAYREQKKNDDLLLARLKRNLKPKIFADIAWDKEQHASHNNLKIVDEATAVASGARKCSGSDYFGFSSAIRHVYSDVSNCSYSGSYGGQVFYRLSKDRYLTAYIVG